MSYAWYLIWATVSAVWVFIDARARRANLYWVAATAVAGPVGLAAYLAFRLLRLGESREGGPAWQFLSMLVVTWTALFVFAALWNLVWSFSDITTIGIAWACVALPALAVGLALKRSTTEFGPVDLRNAKASWAARCERTPDGRNYICRECGKEYSIELPFCDGCGAWPGDSG
jgi:hypothetical protein